jgi:hypothetical protein
MTTDSLALTSPRFLCEPATPGKRTKPVAPDEVDRFSKYEIILILQYKI